MPELKELLPFLLPLMVLQLGFLAVTIHHILTHNTYRRGSRGLWLLIALVGMEFVGPILYFLLGKEEG